MITTIFKMHIAQSVNCQSVNFPIYVRNTISEYRQFDTAQSAVIATPLFSNGGFSGTTEKELNISELSSDGG